MTSDGLLSQRQLDALNRLLVPRGVDPEDERTLLKLALAMSSKVSETARSTRRAPSPPSASSSTRDTSRRTVSQMLSRCLLARAAPSASSELSEPLQLLGALHTNFDSSEPALEFCASVLSNAPSTAAIASMAHDAGRAVILTLSTVSTLTAPPRGSSQHISLSSLLLNILVANLPSSDSEILSTSGLAILFALDAAEHIGITDRAFARPICIARACAPAGDEAMKSVADRLLASLATPSEYQVFQFDMLLDSIRRSRESQTLDDFSTRVQLKSSLASLINVAYTNSQIWRSFAAERGQDVFRFLLSGVFSCDEFSSMFLRLLALAGTDGLLLNPDDISELLELLLTSPTQEMRDDAALIVESADRNAVLEAMTPRLARLPVEGRRASQFALYWARTVVACGGTTSKATKAVADFIHVARQSEDALSQHRNSRLYAQIGKIVALEGGNPPSEAPSMLSSEVFGHYFEAEPCRVCCSMPMAFNLVKIRDIECEPRFTHCTRMVRLQQMQCIASVQIHLEELSSIRSVKTVRLYFNADKIDSLASLKDKRDLWTLAATVKAAPWANDIVLLPGAPVFAYNLMVEFVDFFESADGRVEIIQCPRCRSAVTSRHGICSQCKENAMQCRQCRNINYDHLDGFLCNECGFCRFAQLQISISSRPAFHMSPIRAEAQRRYAVDTTLATHASELQSALDEIEAQRAEVCELLNSESVAHSRVARVYRETRSTHRAVCMNFEVVEAVRRALQLYDAPRSAYRCPALQTACFVCLRSFVQLSSEILNVLSQSVSVQSMLVEANVLPNLLHKAAWAESPADRDRSRAVLSRLAETCPAGERQLHELLEARLRLLIENVAQVQPARGLSCYMGVLLSVCSVDSAKQDLWASRIQLLLRVFHIAEASDDSVFTCVVCQVVCTSQIIKPKFSSEPCHRVLGGENLHFEFAFSVFLEGSHSGPESSEPMAPIVRCLTVANLDARSSQLFDILYEFAKGSHYLAQPYVFNLLIALLRRECRFVCSEATDNSGTVFGGVVGILHQVISGDSSARTSLARTPGVITAIVDAYLCLDGLLLHRSKLTQDASSMLLQVIDETSVRSRICILERIERIVNPALDASQHCQLLLRKAPSQEEFIRGHMLKSAYSSEGFKTMADVRDKICRDLDLADAHGMFELLVNGCIIDLSLPVLGVYNAIWKPAVLGGTVAVVDYDSDYEDSAVDPSAMVITYRLKGLDGEATEDLIERLPEADADKVDPKVKFAALRVMPECGGIACLLEQLESVSGNDDIGSLYTGMVVHILSQCAYLPECREALSPGYRLMLSQLLARLSSPTDGPVAANLLDILGVVVEQDVEVDVANSNTCEISDYLLKHMSQTEPPSLWPRLAVLLPRVTRGLPAPVRSMVAAFEAHLQWQNLEADNYPQFPAECFAIVAESLASASEVVCIGVRSVTYESVVPSALQYLSSIESSDPQHRRALPLVLRILTGLVRKCAPAQTAAVPAIPMLHRLERITSTNKVGPLSENLLEALCDDNPEVSSIVKALRQQTREARKQVALAKRRALVDALRLESTSVGSRRLQGMENIAEDTGLTCMVCQEGYLDKPRDMLGFYVFVREATLPSFNDASDEQIGMTSVTHFNTIHFSCHAEAARADRRLRPPKSEWEGATLRNAQTLCNNLFPIFNKSNSFDEYALRVDDYWRNIAFRAAFQITKLDVLLHDLRMLLERFAQDRSFSEFSRGGARQSNIRFLPYLLQMGAFLIGSSPSDMKSRLRKTTFAAIGEPDERAWAGSALITVEIAVITSLIALKPREWRTCRDVAFRRLLHAACSSRPFPPSKRRRTSRSSSMPADASVKAVVIFWALVDSVHSLLVQHEQAIDATDGANAWDRVQRYIRLHHQDMLSGLDALCTRLTRDLLPVDDTAALFAAVNTPCDDPMQVLRRFTNQ
ncbi:unnamed protein product (mitochondrion) [Plasmodiophora brassicae]|uniref:E3 ubiquitin ligase UBR4 C-terminal domain-containing protein n=1 Tax=Plasmodiophora brassicae TaxID=37360 RepID=A0A3P3Y459_PLABS|nr:unnamed protein product [Plasmodiophora brassicae]